MATGIGVGATGRELGVMRVCGWVRLGMLAATMVAVQGPVAGHAQVREAGEKGRAEISGTVVDTSGAVIAGATVQVRGADGGVARTTETNASGGFAVAGVAAGSYRLVVTDAGFESKEVLVTVGNGGGATGLRIALVVGAVSTTVNVEGRADDLIGIAESGSQGTVGAEEIQDRPMLRSGEVLETVPGLIITQHAGGGKANQYYLRGFNLDHGTDIAIFLDDMPLNLPSHAHGEGYSDMNTVIPELVKRVDFEKGPYYANVGDFGSAAAAHVEFFKMLPESFAKVEGGTYSYGRVVFGATRRLGRGNLLYGGEDTYYDGPWVHPDGFNKSNGLATYSQGDDGNGLSVTARGYRGKWSSSDQIPVTAQVNATAEMPYGVGYFGTLNPTDGGRSQRYSLQGEWHGQGSHSESKVAAYLFYYDMNLFSDFTYYLVDHKRGDQFEQQDRRWVGGLDAHHTVFGGWRGRKMSNTIGVQVRNDWINNGLYGTENRKRTAKTDYSATGISFDDTICGAYPGAVEISVDGGAPESFPSVCPTLPATRERDNFTDTLGSVYVENKTQWASKFRTVVGLRGDDDKFVVASLAYPKDFITLPDGSRESVNAANSGSASKFLPSPKASLIFGPWGNTEFYLQGGFGFHSNDGRGTTQTVQPISADNPTPDTPGPKIPPLVQTKGGEIGVRTLAVPHLQSTFSLWYLRSNSELLQDGDTGGTSASEQSSNRYGLEWANYYTPTEHLSVDFDFANSRAQFTQVDPDDASQTVTKSAIRINGNPVGSFDVQHAGPGGKLVPEAVRVVISSGVTLHDWRGLSSSVRLRYFGPRDLTSDGLFESSRTVLLNGEVSYAIRKRWHVTAEFLNMLDRKDADIDYAYVYQIAPAAETGFGRVNHPSEPFLFRFGLAKSF